MQQFKIHCCQIGNIMGKMGLTEKQEETLNTLLIKPKLTVIQEANLKVLQYRKSNPELPETAISYLKKWYSEHFFGYRDEIYSKYLTKGNMCEGEAIAVCSLMLGDLFEKNLEKFENEYIQGSPDIISNLFVLDTKCPWDGKTFFDAVMSEIDFDYEWQLRGYMALTGLESAGLCYVLLDTPKEANYGHGVIFSNVEIEKRFFQFNIKRDKSLEREIYYRVTLCCEWLEKYHYDIQDKLAVNEL